MKSVPTTPQLERKRKLLLALPVIALPLLTLLFWSMKDQDVAANSRQVEAIPGLNTHLPGAQLKDTGSMDKLSFYEQADVASRKLKQQRDQDPYGKTKADSSAAAGSFAFHIPDVENHSDGLPSMSQAESNEQQIYQRLNKLQAAINRHNTPTVNSRVTSSHYDPYSSRQKRLSEDPELKQMNSIMEKLVQFQHPETVKPTATNENTVNKRFRAISAVVDGKQQITDNTVVRMKLMDSVTINGQLFPKGQLVFAAGMFSNQRMKIEVRSLHIGSVIYPVNLTVYDAEDGLEGISVPEAVTGDVLRNGAVSGVQSIELMSLDPSISAQLATAGVNTAKGLFGKKIKRIKAKLKDKRPVLLRINKPILAKSSDR